MSPSLIISIIAAVISAIAIGVSIWTHNRSHKLQTRIVALEETKEKDRLAEKKKAYLTAKIIKEALPRSGSIKIDTNYYLQIENKGSSEARDIRIWLDDKQVSDHPAFVEGQKEIFVVGPQSHFQYRLSRSRPSGIAIAWSDDSGEVGSYRNALTF